MEIRVPEGRGWQYLEDFLKGQNFSYEITVNGSPRQQKYIYLKLVRADTHSLKTALYTYECSAGEAVDAIIEKLEKIKA